MTAAAGRPAWRLWLRRGLAAAALALILAVAALGAVGWSRAELTAPPASFLLFDRDGRPLGQVGGDDAHGYGYWPLGDVPPRLMAATLALEDRRFWSHPGVDPAAILRAAWRNAVSGRRVSGASTIAMQVARMQSGGGRGRGYLAKAAEAATALALTARYGREEVLRHYLRIAPYGANAHGVAYAARFYFDKPVADLSWAEIALLSAIPQAPTLMNPLRSDGRARAVRRARRILAALEEAGAIDADERRLADFQLDRIRVAPPAVRPPDAIHYLLRLDEELRADSRFPEREPRVVASLDLSLQETVAALTRRRLETWRLDGAEHAAAIVLERPSLAARAWIGSGGYFAPVGAIDYARTPRAAGSTLKPFIYALAVERGVVAPDAPLIDAPEAGRGVANADHAFLGPMLPREALANSRNAPAIDVLSRVGAAQGFALLDGLGLDAGNGDADRYGLGLALGVMPTTLERLTRGYGALADDGRLRDLTFYDGQRAGAPVGALSPDAARLVLGFLADPQARLPSFPRMGPAEHPFAAAVKTGTSQGFRDAWTVVATRGWIVGVWVGRGDGRPMRGLTGGNSAAHLAADILDALYPDARWRGVERGFAAPEGWNRRPVCVGADPDGCRRVFLEWASPRGPDALEAAPAAASVGILSPQNGVRLLRNPEAPPGLDVLPLRVRAEGEIAQILWYVDGRPWRLAAPDEAALWPLEPGRHSFQARVPYFGLASETVQVVVE